VDLRRALARMGPTLEVPWDIIRQARGEAAVHREVLAAARAHTPDVVWAQVHGAWPADFQLALRAATGPNCTLIQWTGDVRTNGAQPVDRWLVDFGHHFDLLLADGCAYARKLKLDERVPAACGYLSCGIDPKLNPWHPAEREIGGAVFLGSHYPTVHFGVNDRTGVFEEVQRLVPGLLTIYGTGWEKTRLAPICKPFVSQVQASLVMRGAALTVATSIYNDLARYTSDRLKRAMASGAVVAVRRFPDMEGLGLRDGENCLYWSAPADLAALMKDWVCPVRLAERTAIRARAAALAHDRFTWDRVTEELLAIVRDYRRRRVLTC
jgi:glycosyltransferase involved in cell wall biosynthesis